MGRRVAVAVAVAAVAIVAASGCTSSHGPGGKAGSRPEPRLVGTTWQLVSYENPSHAVLVPVQIDSTMHLDGKSGYGVLACNNIAGYASIDGRTVTFRPGVTTLVGCVGEAETVERQVDATANGQVTWSISAGILTLTNHNRHVLIYRVQRTEPRRGQ